MLFKHYIMNSQVPYRNWDELMNPAMALNWGVPWEVWFRVMSNLGKPASLSSPPPGVDFPEEGRGRYMTMLLLCSNIDSSQDLKFCKDFHLVFKSSCGCSSPIQTQGLLTACCMDFDFFVVDVLWDVSAHWVHTSRQGTRGPPCWTQRLCLFPQHKLLHQPWVSSCWQGTAG